MNEHSINKLVVWQLKSLQLLGHESEMVCCERADGAQHTQASAFVRHLRKLGHSDRIFVLTVANLLVDDLEQCRHLSFKLSTTLAEHTVQHDAGA